MSRRFTISDLKETPCWQLNPHLHEGVKEKEGKAKYGNRKVEYDGRVFDSKKECSRYFELKTMEAAGEISELECQPVFQLSVCKYIADFRYKRNGETVVEDVKSKATKKLPTYRLKNKMMLNELGIEIKEI